MNIDNNLFIFLPDSGQPAYETDAALIALAGFYCHRCGTG
jgi:hypothetical protein